MIDLQIREIERLELSIAFDVLRELRTHLTYDVFIERYVRQSEFGYQLFGAFADCLVVVLGMRPVETMARGKHLHIDDLVVAEDYRQQRYGTRMLTFAEEWAVANELGSVFVDSRSDVTDFYSSLGYVPHTSLLMRKRLSKD